MIPDHSNYAGIIPIIPVSSSRVFHPGLASADGLNWARKQTYPWIHGSSRWIMYEILFPSLVHRERKIDFCPEKVMNDVTPQPSGTMDQRSICLFLAMKGLSAREVDNELVAVLGLDAIAYSTVTKCLRQRQFLVIFPEPSDELPTAIIDDAIVEAVDEPPFSSVREVAKLTCIPTTTICRHLTGSLGFVLRHLRWVAHTSTDTQKAQRITLSNQLLLELL
jgi:hypothetical protein